MNIPEIYKRLFSFYGDLHWWPAENDFEVLIGAILTQNTSWRNVEKAIESLKSSGQLTIDWIIKMDCKDLALKIRSAGFYNQKAKYIKNACISIKAIYGNLDNMKKNFNEVYDFLSGLKGIGPETRDSILLYALNYRTFVIDNYTLRLFSRLYGKNFSYIEIKSSVEESLKTVFELKNFHAMIVELSKDYCRKKPLCLKCPLNDLCLYGNNRTVTD
ncbi:endonuclease III domain-containing protein [Picrophilus oshimae]|uniref:Endonuclease III n=1 Tax=Picrophilus torridus (strain ATCC 700027 / DSM 9790 / JCM 10055 / NBRC 100828 / KAW 2/3) TaxID=1122961 RepID=Q6L1H4_PICTO|nr:endonuclease III [Picrophilus oshimae]AAT43178.1 endonuclease III [Picrophilus oshimae DSM 9789]